MDNIESIAQRFLLSRGFRQIIYEPDGNVPPDFLVDGSIAIEVRKLNKQLAQLGNEPLEHAAAELYLGLNNVYRSMGLSVDHESWFVFHRFSRPLPRWKMLKKNVIEILTALSQMSIPDSAEMLVDNNLLLTGLPLKFSSRKAEWEVKVGKSELKRMDGDRSGGAAGVGA